MVTNALKIFRTNMVTRGSVSIQIWNASYVKMRIVFLQFFRKSVNSKSEDLSVNYYAMESFISIRVNNSQVRE